MKKVLVRCEVCGNDFSYLWNGTGRKRTICDACRKVKHNECNKNLRMKKKGVKSEKNKPGIILLTCEECGEIFEYNYLGYGKKPKYCSKCSHEIDNMRKIAYKKFVKEKAMKPHKICKHCGKEFTYEERKIGGCLPIYCDECRELLKHKKKEKVNLVCEECGKEIDYCGRGIKPKLCADCKRKKRNEYMAEYYKKNISPKAKKQELKNELNVEITDDIVVDNTKVNNLNFGNKEYNQFLERLLILLQDLDNIRVKMCELSTDLHNYQSQFDKQDQIFLHELEDIAATGDIGRYNSQQFVLKWQASRKGRRDVKDLIEILSPVITSIPLKNVAQAYNKGVFQNGYRRTYNPTKKGEDRTREEDKEPTVRLHI